jgi:hypothetical protein
MAIKLFYGEKSRFEHEDKQIQEIIECITKSFQKETIYVCTNVPLANSELDCLLLTKKGPIILELKNYLGEIIGDENGEWVVKDATGKSIALPENLFQQLKMQRNDLYRKLERIFEQQIPRVDPVDLRKISAWGYFQRGSTYPDGQINRFIVKWFDIVNADTLSYKIAHTDPQYTLFEQDFDTLVNELHLVETKFELPQSQKNEPSPQVISPTKEYEPSEVIAMIKNMASHGTAPIDGCTLFSIGNKEYIDTIKEIYLIKGFNRKSSAEKFIVGQFGSGKTHFVNLISEEARKLNCVTSTIALTKNIDVTNNYYIYRELAREIRPPGTKQKGMRSLLNACFSSIEELTHQQTDSIENAEKLLRGWIDGLEDQNFELDAFGRVVRQAFDARLKNDSEKFSAATRWLEGEFDTREITKILNLSPYTKKELNIIAKRVNLSLYQLIKLCGFQGTVVVFDEAEQGFNISKKKQSMLFSILQSDINSIITLEGGAVLVLYAIHSQTLGEIMNFPALQQRIRHPFKFSAEHFNSPIIEIDRSETASKEEILGELRAIGERLINLMYEAAGSEITVPMDSTYSLIQTLAESCIKEDMTSSNRRAMVKGTCSILAQLHDKNSLPNIDEISITPDLEYFTDDEA